MNLIKKRRKYLKMTQRQLAIKLNVKQSYISEIENGQRSPSIHMLLEISKILKICPVELFVDMTEPCNDLCKLKNDGCYRNLSC